MNLTTDGICQKLSWFICFFVSIIVSINQRKKKKNSGDANETRGQLEKSSDYETVLDMVGFTPKAEPVLLSLSVETSI